MKYKVIQLSHPGMEYPKLNEKGILTYSKRGIEWDCDKKVELGFGIIVTGIKGNLCAWME